MDVDTRWSHDIMEYTLTRAWKEPFAESLRCLVAINRYRACWGIAKLVDALGHSAIETTRIYLVTTGLDIPHGQKSAHHKQRAYCFGTNKARFTTKRCL